MVLKLVSENLPTIDGTSPKKIVYKRSWSLSAVLEAAGFSVLTAGMMSWILQTYDNGNIMESPEMSRNFIIFGGAGIAILGVMIYYFSKEQHFISAICKKYGYSLENLAESIPDTANSGNDKSRTLLPLSSRMPVNVDIYVRRTEEGIFVEEIHH